MAVMTSDWHKRALANPKAIGSPELPIHEDEIHPGFYRMRWRKNEPWQPVAFWIDGDELSCMLGDNYVDHAGKQSQLWTYACRNPISEALYFDVTENGATWPDDIVEPERRNADPLTQLIESIDELIREAERALNEKDLVTDKGARDQAANYATRLTELAQEVETARETEKRPYLEAGREIDAKWTPVRDKAKAHARDLKNRIGAALKAALAAQRAATPDEEPTVDTKAGTRGKTVSLRTYERVEIRDLLELCAFIIRIGAPADFIDVARKTADKMHRAGVDVPGIEIKIEERAA